MTSVATKKERLYYSIGEVKELTGIEPHVLRYWESEFSSFRPKKSRTGHRIYTKKDLDMIARIKHLLYVERFTIEGAKMKLKEEKGKPLPPFSSEKNGNPTISAPPKPDLEAQNGLGQSPTLLRPLDQQFLQKIQSKLEALSTSLKEWY